MIIVPSFSEEDTGQRECVSSTQDSALRADGQESLLVRYRFTTCGRSVFLRIRQKRSPPSRRRSDRFRSGVESGEESSSCEKPCSSCGGQARAHLADSKKDLLLWARLAPVEQPRVVSKVLRNARPCRSDKHERNPILSDPPPPPCPPSRPPPPRCARSAESIHENGPTACQVLTPPRPNGGATVGKWRKVSTADVSIPERFAFRY
mgnify:CR=1 FL=1